MSRNVKVTTRLVPQLNTVAIAMARPLTAAGNISLRTNQVTENIKLQLHFKEMTIYYVYLLIKSHRKSTLQNI